MTLSVPRLSRGGRRSVVLKHLYGPGRWDQVWYRHAVLLTLALAGWGFAVLADIDGWVGSQTYQQAAVCLLAVGLYSSTHGIDPVDVRENWRLIFAAVTIGVLLKAALIAATMVVVFDRPEYLLLGIAVAQVDPLSVAASQNRSHMSDRAKAVMASWASFDDPMTVLISFYCLDLGLTDTTHSSAGAATGSNSTGPGQLGTEMLLNLLFAVVACAVWQVLRSTPGFLTAPRPPNALRQIAQILALLVLFVIAVRWSLLLGIAVTGLFWRPDRIRSLEGVSTTALILATFGLGMVLVHGVHLADGLVLGLAAFCAHAVAALLLTTKRSLPGFAGRWAGHAARRPRPEGFSLQDRGCLALGQQNGITAIILALILETELTGTVAAVAPAILVVNLLHAGTNSLWERRIDSVCKGDGDDG